MCLTERVACINFDDVFPLNLVDPQPATNPGFPVNLLSSVNLLSFVNLLSPDSATAKKSREGIQIGLMTFSVNVTDSFRVRMAMSLSNVRGL